MARHYIIEGRVQGVGFRYFTNETAAQLGVSGWVKNLPGGEVECLADADEAVLANFEKKLWQGPSMSRVTDIKIKQTDNDVPAGFSILR